MLGLSFNPSYEKEPEIFEEALRKTRHFELGLTHLKELNPFFLANFQRINLSLHLARTPITESFKQQKFYIKALQELIKNLPKETKNRLKSIGLHLTGPRNFDIGQLGLSSPYIYSKNNEIKGQNFISLLNENFDLDIWIENANFYSKDAFNMLKVWESVHKIIEKTDAGLILDLTHLLIDSKNNHINPHFTLAKVPIDSIKEVHLSGVFIDKNNIYHDCHSKPITEEVWDLLKQILKFLKQENIVYTLEHSDLSWVSESESFYTDIAKLESLLSSRESLCDESLSFNNSWDNSLDYVKKIVRKRLPNLHTVFSKKSLNADAYISKYLEEICKQEKIIALHSCHILKEENFSETELIDGFLTYLKREIK